MDTLNIFLLVLAGVFLLWQVLLGVGAVVAIARGHKVTNLGFGPGILFVVFLALGLFL